LPVKLLGLFEHGAGFGKHLGFWITHCASFNVTSFPVAVRDSLRGQQVGLHAEIPRREGRSLFHLGT